jgi:hypothetical protein
LLGLPLGDAFTMVPQYLRGRTGAFAERISPDVYVHDDNT